MTSRLARGAAALALAVPLTVCAVAAPAAAADPFLVDRWSPGPLPWSAVPARTTLDTATATDAEAAGLVTVTTSLADGTAAGTGIVLASDGLVVTNHHVVESATGLSVTVVTTGATYVAEVVGTDSTHDVAVLQLEDASGLTAVTTSPGTLTAGDTVTAVGDAGGDGGDLTAAAGVVTDLHHPIEVSDETTGERTALRNLVEVSSDVQAGDSGGALLDAGGDVVGMTVAASSGSTTEEVSGYVIPVGRVLGIVEAVLAGEPSDTVVRVEDDGPAADLGLAAGDTVALTWTGADGTTHSGTTVLVAGPVA